MAYYTCLLLDADNTLLDFNAAEQAAITDTLNHYGLPHDAEAVETYHRVNRQLWDSLARGEINRNKLFAVRFSRVLQALGQPDAGNGREMNDYYENELSNHADLIRAHSTLWRSWGRSPRWPLSPTALRRCSSPG